MQRAILLAALVAAGLVAGARADDPPLPAQCKGFRQTKHTQLLGVSGTYAWRHAWYATSVAFSPVGSCAVSAAGDGTIMVWNLETGDELVTLREGSIVHSIAVSPDGRRVLAGTEGAIRAWDLRRRQPAMTCRVDAPARRVAYSRDGKRALAVVGGKVRILDPESGETVTELAEQGAEVREAAFSPDGATVLGGTDDGTVVIWDVERHSIEKRLTRHQKAVTAVAFTPDGVHAITAGEDGSMLKHTIARGVSKKILGGSDFKYPWALALTPDGERVVSVFGNYSDIEVYDVSSRDKVLGVDAPFTAVSVAVSPDGKTALTSDMRGFLSLWDLKTGARVNPTPGHLGKAVSVAVSPDGAVAVTGGEDSRLCLWDMKDGSLRKTVDLGHPREVTTVAFVGPRQVFSASQEGTLRITDMETGDRVRNIEGAYAGHGAAAVTSGGDRAVVTFNADLELGDFAAGERAKIARAHDGGKVNAVAFSPDGTQILSGGEDGTLRLFTRDREALRTIETPEKITTVVFLPDGRRALAGTRSGEVGLYDTEKAKPIRSLAGHASEVLAVAVSPDGRQALTSAYDETIRLWDLASGAEVDRVDLGSSCDQARGLAFAPDGRSFVASTSRGVLLRFALR